MDLIEHGRIDDALLAMSAIVAVILRTIAFVPLPCPVVVLVAS